MTEPDSPFGGRHEPPPTDSQGPLAEPERFRAEELTGPVARSVYRSDQADRGRARGGAITSDRPPDLEADARRAHNAALEQAFRETGRPFYRDAHGRVQPQQPDAQWFDERRDKAKGQRRKRRDEELDTQLKTLDFEAADPARQVMRDTERRRLEESARESRDRMIAAAEDRLVSDPEWGRSRGLFRGPTDQAQALAAEQERLQAMRLGEADLTDEDLAAMADADPEAAAAFEEARATIAQDEENHAWRAKWTERRRRVEAERIEPEAFAMLEAERIANATPEELAAEADELERDVVALGESLAARQEQLQALQADHEARILAAAQAEQERLRAGVTADQLVDVEGVGRMTVQGHADMAALQAHEARMLAIIAEASAEAAVDLEDYHSAASRLHERHKYLNKLATEEREKNEAEMVERVAQMRATPGLEPLADEIEAVAADVERELERIAALPREQQEAAMSALQERSDARIAAKQRELREQLQAEYREERARQEAQQREHDEVWEVVGAAILHAVRETSTLAQSSFGMADSHTRDAAGQHDASTEGRWRTISQRLARERGMSVEDAEVAARDAAGRALWTGDAEALGLDPEARILSTGEVVVRPDLYFQPDEARTQLARVGATKEQIDAFVAILEDRQEQVADAFVKVMDNRMFGSERHAESLPGRLAKARAEGRADVEAVREHFAERGKWIAFQDNAQLAIGRGVAQVTGAAVGLSAATYKGLDNLFDWDFAKRQIEQLSFAGAPMEAWQEAAQFVPQGGAGGRFMMDTTSGGISLIPSFLGGGLGHLVRPFSLAAHTRIVRALPAMTRRSEAFGRAMSAATTPEARNRIVQQFYGSSQSAMGGVMGGAFTQSYGMAFSERFRHNVEQGMDAQTAASIARSQAYAPGIGTAVTVYLTGPLKGAQSILRPGGVKASVGEMLRRVKRDDLNRALRDPQFREVVRQVGRDLGREMLWEAVQEGMDEFQQSVWMMLHGVDPDMTWVDALGNAVYGALIGAALGGAVPAAGAVRPAHRGAERGRSERPQWERVRGDIGRIADPVERSRAEALWYVAQGELDLLSPEQMSLLGIEQVDIDRDAARQGDRGHRAAPQPDPEPASMGFRRAPGHNANQGMLAFGDNGQVSLSLQGAIELAAVSPEASRVIDSTISGDQRSMLRFGRVHHAARQVEAWQPAPDLKMDDAAAEQVRLQARAVLHAATESLPMASDEVLASVGLQRADDGTLSAKGESKGVSLHLGEPVVADSLAAALRDHGLGAVANLVPAMEADRRQAIEAEQTAELERRRQAEEAAIEAETGTQQQAAEVQWDGEGENGTKVSVALLPANESSKERAMQELAGLLPDGERVDPDSVQARPAAAAEPAQGEATPPGHAAVHDAVDRVIAAMPKLADRIEVYRTIKEAPANMAQSGADQDSGKIRIAVDRLAANAEALAPEQRAAYLDGVISEEVKHLGEERAARALWKISKDPRSFEDWAADYYQQLWNEGFSAEQRQWIEDTYGGLLADTRQEARRFPDAQVMAREGLRMILQARADGRLTESSTLTLLSEALAKHLRAVIAAIKSLASGGSLTPDLRLHVEQAEQVLRTWRTRGGQQTRDSEGKVVGPPVPIERQGPPVSLVTPDQDGALELRLDGDVAALDAGQIVGSADARYPDPRIQPRDRTSKQSAEQAAKMAANLERNPDQWRRYYEGPTTDTGKIIVAPLYQDGQPATNEAGQQLYYVVSGNGRYNAIVNAYDTGRSANYDAGIRGALEGDGIDTAGLRRPVAVVVWQPASLDAAIQMAEASNRTGQLSKTSVETATRDATAIEREGLLALWVPSESGDVEAASNQKFWDKFAEAVGDKGLIQNDGRPSEVAIVRAENALLAMILGDSPAALPTLKKVLERAGPLGIRRQLAGIVSEAGALLSLRDAAPEYDVAPVLAEALETVVRFKEARQAGQVASVEEFFAQGDMFQSGDAAANALGRAIVETPTTSGIRAMLAEYRRQALAVDSTTGDMFGAAPPSRTDIIERALDSRPLDAVLEELRQEFGENHPIAEVFAPVLSLWPQMSPTSRRQIGQALQYEADRLRARVPTALEFQRGMAHLLDPEAAAVQRFVDSIDGTEAAARWQKVYTAAGRGRDVGRFLRKQLEAAAAKHGEGARPAATADLRGARSEKDDQGLTSEPGAVEYDRERAEHDIHEAKLGLSEARLGGRAGGGAAVEGRDFEAAAAHVRRSLRQLSRGREGGGAGQDGAPSPAELIERDGLGFSWADAIRKKERRALREWAKARGVLFPWKRFSEPWGRDNVRHKARHGGVEHDVYYDEVSGRWFKRVTENPMHERWHDYLQRMELHAAIFPHTAYRLEGVLWDEKTGRFGLMVSQPDVKGQFNVTPDETRKFMERRGFVHVPVATADADLLLDGGRPVGPRYDEHAYYNPEHGLWIRDLHERNVVRHIDGDPAIIDPVIEVARAGTTAGYRAYRRGLPVPDSPSNPAPVATLNLRGQTDLFAGTPIEPGPIFGRHEKRKAKVLERLKYVQAMARAEGIDPKRRAMLTRAGKKLADELDGRQGLLFDPAETASAKDPDIDRFLRELAAWQESPRIPARPRRGRDTATPDLPGMDSPAPDGPVVERDPRLVEAFGENYEADERGMPVIPTPLPDGHPLLQETHTKATASLPANHPLVAGLPADHSLAHGLPENHPARRGGFLPAGEVTRQQLQDALVEFFMSFGQALPEGTAPTVFATGGGGGAGKSTILHRLTDEGKINTEGAVPVNADDIKILIPEWGQLVDEAGDGRAAVTVHEESSIVSKRLLARLTESRRHDFIYDATLANRDKAIERFKGWKAEGFHVQLIGVVIDPREAITRAYLRAKRSGRWVPYEILQEAHDGFRRGILDLARAADAAQIYDNNLGPVHVASRAAGQDGFTVAAPDIFATLERREKHGRTTETETPAGRAGDLQPGVTDQGDGAAREGRPAGAQSVEGEGRGTDTAAGTAAGELDFAGRGGVTSPDAEPAPAGSPADGAARAPGDGRAPDPSGVAQRAGRPDGQPADPGQAELDFAAPDRGPAAGDRRPGEAGAQDGGIVGGPAQRGAPGSGDVDRGGSRGPASRPDGDRGEAAGDGESAQSRGAVGGRRRRQRREDDDPQRQRPPVGSPDRNHEIEPTDVLAPRGAKTKARANIDAIHLLRRLESEDRNPTPDEKRQLAQYVGWGGISQVFDQEKGPNALAGAQQSLRQWLDLASRYGGHYEQNIADARARVASIERWQAQWGELHDTLKELLTDEEWRAARDSTINAHYTSADVIRPLWAAVERLGFKGGLATEPAGGVGHFIGLTPAGLRDATVWRAVELDSISSRILAKLYPEAGVETATGFEATRIPDHSMDLVISNVPFAAEGPYDPSMRAMGAPELNLHNYFFAQALRKAKPGGLVAFITSAHTMDSSIAQRSWLASQGEFLGAIRLPNNAFRDNAGTDVVTDIIFLRKPRDGAPRVLPEVGTWTGVEPVTVRSGDSVQINEYFVRNPDMVLGRIDNDGSMYGNQEAGEMTVHPTGDLGPQLAAAIQRLPQNVVESDGVDTGAADTLVDGAHSFKMGAYGLNAEGGLDIVGATAAEIAAHPLSKVSKRPFLRDYLEVRNALNALYQAEANEAATDQELSGLRATLNRAYDRFLSRHGLLHKANKLLSDDPDYYRTLGLEVEADSTFEGQVLGRMGKKAFQKADVFAKRILTPRTEPTAAESVADALGISLGWRGRLDIPFMADLLGESEATVEQELLSSGRAFLDPASGAIVESSEYLSGNVRKKLALAKERAKQDARMKRNVDALDAIQPPDVPIQDIHVNLSSQWMPPAVATAFAKEILGSGVEVTYVPPVGGTNAAATGEWRVDGWEDAGSAVTFGLRDSTGDVIRTARSLLESALNMRDTKIYRTVDDQRILDVNLTTGARDIIARMNDSFTEWVSRNEKVSTNLEKVYNETFNSHVLAEYDGSHLPMPWVSKQFELYPSKKNVVWRALRQGNLLVAHGVGGGKTLIGTAIAMEAKRLKLANKPLIVVHNATLEQFAETITQVAPGARVLVARKSDLAGAKRKEFMARIRSGDWDAVVMAQSSFDLIPDDPDVERRAMGAMLQELEETIRSQQSDTRGGGRSRTVKQLVKQRNALIKRQAKLRDRRTDDVLTFQELGIDMMIVDEVHAYKKMPFVTKMQQLAGVDTGFSKRGNNLLMRARWIQEQNGGRGVISMTGTPVTNTLGESWNMVRLVRPDLLEDFGVQTFDQFVSVFAQAESSYELRPNGEYKSVQRLSELTNLPEWSRFFGSAADVKLGGKMDVRGRPEIAGGKAQLEAVERTPLLADFVRHISRVIDDYDRATGEEKRDLSHIPLLTYNASRMAAIDVRMVDPGAPDEAGSKANRAVRRVLDFHKQTAAYRGTQVIFADSYRNMSSEHLEIPPLSPERTGATEFNLYHDIRDKLVAGGVPAAEIAIIHDYKTDAARQKLFDQVNRGKVRIVLGSTETLGTGVNMQERMVAAHHLDVPWTPAGLEQRDGRVYRQGNVHAERGEPIHLIRYGAKDSLDAALWQKLETKEKFTGQALSGDITSRSLKDDGALLTFAEQKAILSGEMGLRKFQADEAVKALRREESAHTNRIQGARQTARTKRIHRDRAVKDAEAARALAKKLAPLADLESRPGEILVNGQRHDSGEAVKEAVKALVDARTKAANSVQNPETAPSIRADLGTLSANGIEVVIEVRDVVNDYADAKAPWKVSYKLRVGDSPIPTMGGGLRNAGWILRGLYEAHEQADHLASLRTTEVERTKEAIAAAEKEAAEPFKKAAQLEAALKEQATVNAELGIGGADADPAPAATLDIGSILGTRQPQGDAAPAAPDPAPATPSDPSAPLYDALDRRANERPAARGAEQRARDRQARADRASDRAGLPRKRVAGRPDLSGVVVERDDQAVRDEFDFTDEQRRAMQNQESVQLWIDEGHKLVNEDAAGVERRLLRSALNADDVSIRAEDVMAARILVERRTREALASGDRDALRKAGMLRYAYRETRADTARALAAGRDLFRTPAERHRGYLSDALLRIPPKIVREIDRRFPFPKDGTAAQQRTSVEGKRAAVDQAIRDRLAKIEGELQKMGVTLEEIFAGEAYLRLRAAPILQGAVKPFTPAEQMAIRLIQDAAPIKKIARVTELSHEQIENVRNRLRATLKEKLRAKVAAGATLESIDLDGAAAMTLGLAPVATANLTAQDIEAELNRILDVGFGLGENHKTNVTTFRTRKRKPRRAKVDAAGDLAHDVPWARPGFDQNMSWRFDIRDRAHVMQLARAIIAMDGDWIDSMAEWYYNAILSGTHTQAVNIAGTAIYGMWNASVGRGMEALLNTVLRSKEGATFGEYRHTFRALMPHLKRAASNAYAAFMTETPFFEEDILNREMDVAHWGQEDRGIYRVGFIKGRKGRWIRLATRGLLAMDEFFKTWVAGVEVGGMAYRLGLKHGYKAGSPQMQQFIRQQLNLPGSAAWQQAAQKAYEAAFTTKLPTDSSETHSIGDMIALGAGTLTSYLTPKSADAGHVRLTKALLKLFFFPFQRTPFNIIRTGGRHVPNPITGFDLGFNVAKHLRMENGKFVWKGGDADQALAIEMAAKQLQGLVFLAFLMGIGEGDDDDLEKWLLVTGSKSRSQTRRGEREMANRMGLGPYSISVRLPGGGRWTASYRRFDPIATVFGTLTDATQEVKHVLRGGRQPGEATGAFMGSLVDQMGDKTFLQGFGEFISMTRGERNMSQWTAGRIASYVPNIFKQPLRQTDDHFRERTDGFLQELLYQSAPHGLNPAAPPERRDFYGEPVGKGSHALIRLFDISRSAGYDEPQPWDRMAYHWNREHPDDPIAKQEPSNLFTDPETGERERMTPGQYARYKEVAGRRAVVRLRRESFNINRPTEDDRRRFERAVDAARADARLILFRSSAWRNL